MASLTAFLHVGGGRGGRLALRGFAGPQSGEAWSSMCIVCPVIRKSPHFCRGDCRDSQLSLCQLPNQYLWLSLPQAQEEWAAAIEVASPGCLEFQHSEKDSDLLWSQTGMYHSKEIAKYFQRCHVSSRVHSPSSCLGGQVSQSGVVRLLNLWIKSQKISCKGAQEQKIETAQRWGELPSGSWCLRRETNPM